MSRVCRSLVLVFALGSLHCGAILPRLEYSSFGDADPARDRKIREASLEGFAVQDEQPKKDVRVLVDMIPEGLDIDDGKIQVLAGYEHQLIGKFSMAPQTGGPFTLLTFADYQAGWRKGYCYPQVVLNWATLTLWSVLVPLSYVCWGHGDISKEDAIENAKTIAANAGGDLVILGYLTYPGWDPEYLLGVAGYIIKVDPRMKNQEMKLENKKLAENPQTL